ncbi:MAG: DEAD/DEAH box helicase [Mitsuaria chitosanitabida]|uniref:DEAD/DEAH box helicase n=1 Tax=Roseateles chitosanitabidus TaxID=65048 RepID=UPI001B1D6547|nr:DEAD/DEAH box helicase [Roseateles chitosanitabidus]MBO9685343.1 DEAD/DEAH box helicase [Roseateles chitosanitabidus]
MSADPAAKPRLRRPVRPKAEAPVAAHDFHPAVQAWFARAFPAPTPAQAAAWPAIQAGRHTLVAAPTGSGKTLTAFLAALDALVRRGLSPEGLPDECCVVYVSPLKALSNDIQLNLEAPLAGIREELARLGLPDVHLRTAVRTGDTPAGERQQVLRRPPHIVVTTPESLYVLMGSASGRRMLASVRSVIVDEIHALASSKRGSHLALTLERLQALTGAPLTRIGLSATQKPIEVVARFLTGGAPCEIVDIGYGRERDLALELPPTPLSVVMSTDQWEQVYARVAELVLQHRTTLVFVNTRRMAERAARHLGERLGRERVAAHHGSLAKEARLQAERRLKAGELRVLVATASLELGLDIGEVDLVCQLGSPRSIATFLQRAGRSRHQVGGVPKARLFPQTRDELVECAALLDAVRRGELDALRVPVAPLDVLAQQIVAEVACQEWGEAPLYDLIRRAWPYRALSREDFGATLRMVSEGFGTRQGPRGGYVHRDAVHQLLRERKGARMTALTSGGTIPDAGDYTVILEPQADRIGTVNEDFAVESLAGDVFQLGNTSYRILRVEPGRVRVEDAQGAAPNIPFWLGEAPGRTDELSQAVSRLRADFERCWRAGGEADALAWAREVLRLDEESAAQLVDYLARGLAALGVLPTQDRILLERFFDESGGMQLLIHSPRGSRLNRAWGLALRKRFCRQFNFELQAAATEDVIVLSLSTSHSFPLPEVARYLHSASAEHVLIQALLDAPLFGVRWRWNATTALALPRMRGGQKVAPQLQRMKSEDLLAAVFPDQVACLENIVGEREVPDHPLVRQTLDDCLHDAMDTAGWLTLLRRMEAGEVEVIARDLPAPSPLAAEALNARPYAFLDDAPIEERRTLAVQSRRYGEPAPGDELGQLSPEAIAAVREEAWPRARDADEMHEALLTLGVVTDAEAAGQAQWSAHLAALVVARRATRLVPVGEGGAGPGAPSAGKASKASSARPASSDERGAGHAPGDAGGGLWVCVERLADLRLIHAGATEHPSLTPPPDFAQPSGSREDALRDLLRGRLGGLGPVTATSLATALRLPRADIEGSLLALQTEGVVMQGQFTPGRAADADVEWCERHLLARIHRYTLKRLRQEIEPCQPHDFMRFLLDWQHAGPTHRLEGREALPEVLAMLEGYEAAAGQWESEILPARLGDYASAWLDELCTAGRMTWSRLRPSTSAGGGAGGSLKTTPVLLVPRRQAAVWSRVAPSGEDGAGEPGSRAQRVLAFLASHGAAFFDEMRQDTRLLPAELEDALAELVQRGRVTCDSFAGLRALMRPASKRTPSRASAARAGRGGRAFLPLTGVEDAGRWSLVAERLEPASPEDVEHVVRTLLRRYGVIAWRLLEREAAWLPPWRALVRVCRRLEARGELRGGRFIAGLSGEQFALPEAVARLREVRRQKPDERWTVLSAADPANLLGPVVLGEKLPRTAGARVLWRGGVPVATQQGGETRWLVELEMAERREAELWLLGGRPSPRPSSAERERE